MEFKEAVADGGGPGAGGVGSDVGTGAGIGAAAEARLVVAAGTADGRRCDEEEAL